MFSWKEMLIAIFEYKEIRNLKQWLSYSPGGTCPYDFESIKSSFCFFTSSSGITISVTIAIPINSSYDEIGNYKSEEFKFPISVAERIFKEWESKQLTLFTNL